MVHKTNVSDLYSHIESDINFKARIASLARNKRELNIISLVTFFSEIYRFFLKIQYFSELHLLKNVLSS